MKGMSNQEDKIERILDKIDNYKQTVGVIGALGLTLVRHYDAKFRIGHKLHPSSQNRIQAKDPVTPDIVAQGKNIALIGEVKKSFPQDHKRWLADIKQIEKYDDILNNWLESDVKNHDVMLLIHMSRSVSFKKFLISKIQKKQVVFTHPLSIVEFVRNSERNTFFALRKIWGQLTNKTLDKYLSTDPINVRADEIVVELSTHWFYDSEPEPAYTMSILWDKIFPNKISPEMYRKAGSKKKPEITITINEILNECKTFFSSPNSSFPRKSWINKAMDELVKLKRAKKIDDGVYKVFYQRINPDPLKIFVKELLGKNEDIRNYTNSKKTK